MNSILVQNDFEETQNIIKKHQDTKWIELDPQLKAFAYVYLESYSHRKASKEVFGNPDRGIKILRNPIVAAFIGYLQEKMNVTNIITEDFVRSQWLQLIPKLSGEEPVPFVNSDGYEVEVKQFHASALVSVLKELSKSTKFYENGSGISGGVSISLNLSGVISEGNKISEKDISNAVIIHRTDSDGPD